METTLIADCGRHSTKYSLISKRNKWTSEVQVKLNSTDQLTSSTIDEEDWLNTLPSILDSTIIGEDELRLLFLLNPLCPRQQKEALLIAAFEQYGARKVCLECTAPASLFSCGETSGIVVDVGYTAVRITPVLKGIPAAELSTSLYGVGSFFTESELISSLSESYPAQEIGWRSYMNQIMPEVGGEASVSGCRTEIALPDGSLLPLSFSSSTISRAADRLLLSGESDVLDTAWYTLMKSINTEANSHFLRSGGAAHWHICATKLATSFNRSITPTTPSEVLSKNSLHSSVVGGSILSQLSCFKNMCISVEDYNDEGPHGCVRQYSTDPR